MKLKKIVSFGPMLLMPLSVSALGYIPSVDNLPGGAIVEIIGERPVAWELDYWNWNAQSGGGGSHGRSIEDAVGRRAPLKAKAPSPKKSEKDTPCKTANPVVIATGENTKVKKIFKEWEFMTWR